MNKNLLGVLLCGASVVALSAANAAGLPTRGHYVSGTGSINKASQSLTVKQSSTTGIIDWNSFSIGSKGSVTFNNGGGATLNRVTGGNLSKIAGSLHATGSLYIMNSAGVIVSGTGRVVAGGNFAVSTGNIGGTAFDADRRFKAGAGNIVNKGTIIAGGSAALVGRNVSDTGSIHASAVDLTATRNLSVSGTITAQKAGGTGGVVTARAHTIVIGTDGAIDASGQKAGTISIVARGTTTVAGTLKAEGTSAGGFIETSGEHVHVADSAHISTRASQGKAGTWLIDPQDFTIAASGGDITGATLSGELGSNNILIQSIAGATAGNGDIFVNDTVTWSSSHTLTLDAYRNIVFNAPITITGAGGLKLIDADQTQTNNTPGGNDGNAADGDLIFNSGSVAFTDVTSGNDTALTINGQAYTLENSVADLASDIAASNGNGFYALANNYDASNDATYTASPIVTIFTGTFEGLGNTISNLKITDNAGGNIGFFSEADGAVLRDVALDNISVIAMQNVNANNVGGLVGLADQTAIDHVRVTGTVQVGDAPTNAGAAVGGVAGDWALASGASTDVSSDVLIEAGANNQAGGLAGVLPGNGSETLSDSHASGDVNTGEDGNAGGFAAQVSDVTVTNSYATGTVTAGGSSTAGGFVGSANSALSNDYATGNVFVGTGLNSTVGGFAGNASGNVDHSWSSGNVTVAPTTSGQFAEVIAGGFIGDLGSGAVTNSSASGNVTSGVVFDILQGGFVGFATGSSSIATSYATGNVASEGTPTGAQIGGFVGYDNSSGTISESYATGAVSLGFGPPTPDSAQVGGFIALADSSAAIDESYSTGKVTAAGSGIEVGGFAGENRNTAGMGASLGDFYNATANAGAGIGKDAATTSSVTGLTAANMLKTSSYTGWTFGTLGSGADWVIVDLDSSLNNAGSTPTGGTTPMLLSEYSTTITNAHQLELMNLNLSANYTLANDIDASATAGGDVWSSNGFVPIGTYYGGGTATYNGTFNGQNHVIDGLFIDSDTTGTHPELSWVGLFGALGGTAENVGLTNVDITGNNGEGALIGVGALAGTSYGTIANAWSSGTVTASQKDGLNTNAGGLVGYMDTGTISNSHSSAAVSDTGIGGDVGGLIGFNLAGGTIEDSYATGNVTGGDNSFDGGFIGYAYSVSGLSIMNSYATGNVTAGNSGDAGGFIGIALQHVSIVRSFATGNVTGSGDGEYGGFAGDSDGTLSEDYAGGNISKAAGSASGGDLGGFIGGVDEDAHITESYSTGSVSGENTATLGGFVGSNGGNIDESYTLSKITGGETISTGAFVGDNNTAGNIGATVNDYYDTTINGSLAGFGENTGSGTITGLKSLTTSQMHFASNFTGWTSDFGTTAGGDGWVIVDNNGSLNNHAGQTGGTTPMLLSEWSNTILSGHQLQLMELDPAATYTLAGDIDASGTAGGDVWGSQGFIAIGGNGASGEFSGTFDGASHTINGLYIDDATNTYVGLFGQASGTIENVALTGANVTASSAGVLVGALVGSVPGSVTNSSAAGAVTSTSDSQDEQIVGGLAGDDTNGSVTNSHADVAVTGGDFTLAGGLLGHSEGTLDNSYATGNVMGGAHGFVGGLVGETFSDIANSFATGSVIGGASSAVGGLVGSSNTGSLHNTFATGAVTGGADSIVGGLEGRASGTIDHSNATGDVSGGVESSVGGLVGISQAQISDSYATGNATSSTSSDVGGLVGNNQPGGTIDESYSLGAATGDTGSVVGGLVGQNDGTAGATTTVYFSSDNNAGTGVGAGTAIANGKGLSHTAMQNHASFSGWTFGALGSGADWVIVDKDDTLNNASGATGGTTPMLLSEYSTSIASAHQLQLMQLDLTAQYTVVSDIDASGTQHADTGVWSSAGFIPVGATFPNDGFTGVFDGDDHTVDNLFIHDATNMFVGLFGSNAGSISNLTLSNASVSMVESQGVLSLELGILAGGNSGSIDNVTVSGTVSAPNMVIEPDGVGGLVGANYGSITLSGSSAKVSLSGSTTADLHAGGLVGLNTNGTISESYSTGAVTVEGNAATAGGLVGLNYGNISQSWSSGAATAISTGGTGSVSDAGGLVGINYQGAISQSYAIGAAIVSGGATSMAGGLVADNESTSTIAQSYSIGTVTGGAGSTLGGLVGLDDASSGSITSSYFDTQTSGIGASQGAGNVSSDSGIAGVTTATLESGLPTGFSSSTWGIVSGVSMLYLKWQFPTGTPQVVSGFMLSAIDGADVSGQTISLMQGGSSLNSALTGGSVVSYADGSFYFLLAPGSIASNTSAGLIVYDTAEHAETFVDQADASPASLLLTKNYLTEETSQTTLSAVASDLATADGGANPVVAPDLQIDASGAFNINQTLSYASGTVILSTDGSVNQTAAIAASKLLLEGAANYTLADTGNSIATLAMEGDGSLTFVDDRALSIGTVEDVNGVDAGGGISLTTVAGAISITQQLEAENHPLTLNSAATIAESGAGLIEATTLSGTSHGAVTLNDANVITDLGAFSTGGNNAFALTDANSLTTKGTVTTGTAGLTLTTKGSGHGISIGSALTGGTVKLVSAAAIGESASVGKITATTLTGSSVGTAEMNGATNAITNLGAFSSGSTFELTDDHHLSLDGTLNAGAHTVELKTTSGNGIAIDAELEGATVELTSAATISESSAGDIDAAKLEGSSVSTAVMTSAKNTITDLSTFTSGSTFELTDDHALTLDGALNAGAHTVELTTTGSGHNIAIDAKLEGATVELTSAAAISESSAGAIDATKLEGSSVSTAEMNSATNTIADLGAFTSGSTFELTDDRDLALDGTLNAGLHTVELTTTGSGHDLAIDAKLEGGTVELTSAATISEGGAGDIDATKLEGSAVSTAEMNSAKNTITDLSTFTSGSTFELTDDYTLTVDGAVSSGSAATHLTTTGSGHSIAVDAKVSASDLYLVSAAAIAENSSGDIDATKLLGSSVNSAVMNSALNTITDLGAFSTNGTAAFELTDDHGLTVDGAVSSGTGTLDLTTVGSGHNLAIDSAVTGGTVNLVTTGAAAESSAGAITAAKFNVTAQTGINLTSTHNAITKVGTDKTTSGPNKITL